MGMIKRNCDNCGKEYNADTRNLRRGWGRCCCKSCAAQLREKNKPGYNPERVAVNNARRKFWADCPEPERNPNRNNVIVMRICFANCSRNGYNIARAKY